MTPSEFKRKWVRYSVKPVEYLCEQKKKEGPLSTEEDARYQERFKKIAQCREHLKQLQAHDEYMWTEFVV